MDILQSRPRNKVRQSNTPAIITRMSYHNIIRKWAIFLDKQIATQALLFAVNTHHGIAVAMMPGPQPASFWIIRKHGLCGQTFFNRLQINRTRLTRPRTKLGLALTYSFMRGFKRYVTKFADALSHLRILHILCSQRLQFTSIATVDTFSSSMLFFKRAATNRILTLTHRTGQAWTTHVHPFLSLEYMMLDIQNIHRQEGMIQEKSVQYLCTMTHEGEEYGHDR